MLELLESIARMLEGLKPKVRQAFLLAQCEGLTHKQIADQLAQSLEEDLGQHGQIKVLVVREIRAVHYAR